MSDIPYLFRLITRLASGLEPMDEARKHRHRGFLLSAQGPDGGFRGREGDSDLYYTSFAARGLAVLGGFETDEAERVAGFLRASLSRQASVIDLASWLNTALIVGASGGPDLLDGVADDWPDQVAAALQRFRTQDGGYAKSTEGAAGSTYHSFLVAICYELIDRPIPEPDRLARFVLDRRRADGGFVEIAPMKRSGANPTAAAVVLLNLLGAMTEPIREGVRAFLNGLRSDEGGFQANSRIPFADGLSTFTALLTAQDLRLDEVIDRDRIERFITGLELPTGGFCGASWDQHADVEYTFYGLGVLALLQTG